MFPGTQDKMTERTLGRSSDHQSKRSGSTDYDPHTLKPKPALNVVQSTSDLDIETDTETETVTVES